MNIFRRLYCAVNQKHQRDRAVILLIFSYYLATTAFPLVIICMIGAIGKEDAPHSVPILFDICRAVEKGYLCLYVLGLGFFSALMTIPCAALLRKRDMGIAGFTLFVTLLLAPYIGMYFAVKHFLL